MLSAPATIPATNAGIFTNAFTPPLAGNDNRFSTSPASPQRSASATTGASPAHDTRFGSSNTAETCPGL